MNNKTINSGSPDGYINTLVDAGIPHKIIYTNSSTSIIVGEKEILFTESELKAKDLGFIGRVKKEVIENAQKLNLPERHPIFYRIYPTKTQVFESLSEIDISHAYWQTAFNIGLISEQTYKRGESLEKSVRLIAFGAGAVVRRTFEFDGIEYVDAKEESNEHGRRAYFFVSSLVTSALRDICEALPGATLLYWVDAIVCRPGYEKAVSEKIHLLGYECKIKPLSNCHFSNENGVKVLNCTETETGRKKAFREFSRQKNDFINKIKSNFKK